MLVKELPTKDLDGQTIYASKLMAMQIKNGKEVNETMIAKRRNKLKHKYFMYQRKKAKWLSLYHSIERKIKHPVHFDESYLTRKFDLNDSKFFESDYTSLASLNIRIKDDVCLMPLLCKVGAILCGIWCLFLLINETALIFD